MSDDPDNREALRPALVRARIDHILRSHGPLAFDVLENKTMVSQALRPEGPFFTPRDIRNAIAGLKLAGVIERTVDGKLRRVADRRTP